MLCNYCNAPRRANEGPCPHCGAPSPLLTEMKNDFNGYDVRSSSSSWGGPDTPDPSLPWDKQASSDLLLAQQSRPVPALYQPATHRPLINERALVPATRSGALVPALPEEEGAVYVPPMYTKPRALIPQHRAISGLLSLLIVAGLLCTGAGYYAQATGKIDFLRQMYGLSSPQQNSQDVPAAALPDPAPPAYGPAKTIINSGTTASRIDAPSHTVEMPTAVFKPIQMVYVTYSVQNPPAAGRVKIQWYTQLPGEKTFMFFQSTSTPQSITDSVNGSFASQFSKPMEGKAELYWEDAAGQHDQLAMTLFFVVR